MCTAHKLCADPGCLSRILDPGSRISDPGSRIQKQQQKREVKKICCHAFLCSNKFHRIVNYFSFEVLKKKNLGQFSNDYRTFCQKNCQKALTNMVLGSGIRDPEKTYSGSRIPDPGVKKAPDPGSRIPDPGSGSATLQITLICHILHIRQDNLGVFSMYVFFFSFISFCVFSICTYVESFRVFSVCA